MQSQRDQPRAIGGNMVELTSEYIRKSIADSKVIYQRGLMLYEHGTFSCRDADPEKGSFRYEVDGTYGDYTVQAHISRDRLDVSCDCPYPSKGCKHAVAVLHDIRDRLNRWRTDKPEPRSAHEEYPEPYLSVEEIRNQALEDRIKKASQERFEITLGEMYKGEHLVQTPKGMQYVVTLHDPAKGRGHCTCPDFLTNRLGVCKHLVHVEQHLKSRKDFKKRLELEKFPFIDIFWDSSSDRPCVFCERPQKELGSLAGLIAEYFDSEGIFSGIDVADFLSFISRLDGNKKVRIQPPVLDRLDARLADRQMKELSGVDFPALEMRTKLYPYQEEGVRFAVYRKCALIGDEMGLGKTFQAIAAALLKKEVFGFDKVLVVTLASLKEQWRREVERFTSEKAVIVAGSASQRKRLYETDGSLFKITNYEAVLRDYTIVSRFKPDVVILDEAQRIKNFTTKTAEAVKRIPRRHALVLTGTPLENKLEDVYSIVQFLDPHLLSPLWQFAADHFMLSRDKKGKILGYRNLDALHEKLKPIVIRRKKEEVLSELPEEVVNNYYLDLSDTQRKIHAGYLQSLLPLLNKKYLTPMDIKRMQELLTKMRMVCNSTYLIDRRTNISPKLAELEGILDELVLQNGRKLVVFSEWTTMNFLIAKHLSDAGIGFVELSGKVPVNKRHLLIDEFTRNPECKVFLSTDAGGTGLNLQAADCVINFELPWNPARMRQRIGRVNRIGQKSRSVNVVNLIMKNSIEEKILAGIQLKTDLFQGVFDGGIDVVEFSREKRTEMLNKLREMMGEEPELLSGETRPADEIPEEAPYYLNPQALQEKENIISYDEEEATEEEALAEPPEDETIADAGKALQDLPAPQKIEETLNSGMHFLSGLFEMATGKRLDATGSDQKMLTIDKQTGEVILKFRLPNFR
jgi:superfamily II DNA or RNA helicase